MKEFLQVFQKEKIDERFKIVEEKECGAFNYQQYTFTNVQVDKLKKLGFPLEIDAETLITELHKNTESTSIKEYRESLSVIAENIQKQPHNGFVIGVSWAAPQLKFNRFAIEEISEDIAKEFNAGHFVENQNKIASETIERIEELLALKDDTVDKGDDNETPPHNVLSAEEEAELARLDQELTAYEKMAERNPSKKFTFSDIKLAWMSNEDFLKRFIVDKNIGTE